MTIQSDLSPYIEINPSSEAIGSVIWMHGLGADANDFVPIAQELNLPDGIPLRFIFPNAPLRPITINNGYVMRAWYDITSMTKIEGHIDHHGINQSVNQINELIHREIERGISSNKIVLAGFSQGALIALIAGLRFKNTLAGILALSGYLPYSTDDLTTQLTTANRNIPIFLGHGTEDTVVPYALGQYTNDVLKKQGFDCSFHHYRMAHAVCPQEIDDIAEWVKKVFNLSYG